MAYGNIKRTLEAIKRAQTPDRFTQDYLSSKLGLKGGWVKSVIPFLKKTEFLSSDGTPTSIYKEFRNGSSAGAAAARALKTGFSALYEVNEEAHSLDDAQLKGLILQVTGFEENSSTLPAIVGSFKALRSYADFSALAVPTGESAGTENNSDDPSGSTQYGARPPISGGINLGYTINLNLPATSDVAVFDALFRSLREHLL
ncbi:DUF5343 domain-containing protein [Saccharopolyspora sp. 6M]|uniref:DUF5343 domain-containing protein n=1 Tax=Saccharopolyspora sp. 6M TaxID=2877237 RepID=UPI001CD4AA0F|nr:DUF5343 domain-containing protein [Saccharopolyspora sp. 6M]MCA1224931.1 DUF5343 domain-containing protein [Saccharopolyspora sp. 6M]